MASISLPVPGLGFRLEYSEEALAAPFHSRDFERRFQTEMLAIRSLIKEVVLGSRTAT